ncbi:hypothetical protein [Pseudoalteromonas sp. JSTW]|uniref:hypothetical protein n=1 Tax=Pseudoalteromonas sp. JSTW TaxID=2752475 RepID=UPI0015D56C03|nr:hypothetical protein [Pseudoalteromonas sp. JSTW]QLJ09081.1 hypothetical protein GZH31_04315 [Pseudoalteromonas sp. JSTW]
MTKYEFDIDESYMDKFFRPIKNKAQLIELLMNAIKYMLINPKINKDNAKGNIILIIDKMQRLLFVKNDKIFSIAFPFTVTFFDDAYFFNYKGTLNLDAKLTSDVISLINNKEFYSSCSYEFATPISDYQEDKCDSYWDLIRDLLLMESGYLRYDHDPKNYEKHGKSNIHPLHHYDMFYSSNATFKVGLKKKIIAKDFIDLLDIKTVCKFLD